MVDKHRFLHLAFIISLAFLLIANLPVLSTIFDEWNSDGPYSHGFLGILVVIYVFWSKRNAIQPSPANPLSFIVSMVGLIGSFSVYLVAMFSSIQQLQQFALFFIILFLFSAFYGFKTLKEMALPFLMLFLIFPVWNVLQYPLRELSTAAGVWGPELIGIPVGRDGYRLSTAGGLFDVEPACSGLGFFMVAALLAFCVSFFNKLTTKKTLIFLVICLAIAVLANWLRVIIIIVVGTYTEMNHFIVHDHLTFGWIVFALCLLPLIFIARTYFDGGIDKSEPKDQALTNQSGNQPANQPANQSGHQSNNNTVVEDAVNNNGVNKAQLFSTFLVLIVFIATSYWIPSRFNENYALAVPDVPSYEMVNSNKSYSPNWKPYSQGASSERFFYYTKEALGFQVYVADYIKQEQASEMIFVENYLFNQPFWHLVEEGELTLLNNDKLQETDLVLVQKSEGRYRLIASWYVINGVLTSDKKRAKLEEVKATILGQPGATLVAVAFDFDGQNIADAEKHLNEFISAYLNSFN